MASNTTLVDYALYDFNNRKGKVPFLDDTTARQSLRDKIISILGVSP